LTTLIEEFFVGTTHDANMTRMVEFFEKNNVNLKENEFKTKFDVSAKTGFDEHYMSKRYGTEDLVYPLFTNYKMISLD
jgi:hypothetical protein